MTASGKWEFWVDRGGTFTDIIGRAPDGSLQTLKLLSSRPEAYDDPVTHGVRRLLGIDAGAPLPGDLIGAIKIGTTIATNALLERQGARVLFITTRGHRDAVAIGYQDRPDIFARNIRKPELLHESVASVPERVRADGTVEVQLDEYAVWKDLNQAYHDGIRSLAVCFMHAYAYPAHERRVGEIAREVGFKRISLSHEVSPLIRFVARSDTTVLDAYLSPLLRDYLHQLTSEYGKKADKSAPRLMFMRSQGGLATPNFFSGKDAVLSGPAGGVVGAVKTAAAAGYGRLIGFDMGGTSTDVCHFDGSYERVLESTLAGVRLRVPMLKVHTVAAGGGSLLRYEGGRLQVGPRSAGASPGPMSYRSGGPLTLTDANLLVGKLDPDHFPRIFGRQSDEPLDRDSVERAFDRLAGEIGDGRSAEDLADGFIRIAVDNMANAIKTISVQQGYDLSDYLLAAFGGAGGQHACRVADSLGMARVLIHPLSSLLSAYGIGLSPLRASRQQTVTLPLATGSESALLGLRSRLEAQTRAELAEQGVAAGQVTTGCRYHLRYDNADTTLPVPAGEIADMRHHFENEHRQRFGFVAEGHELIVDTIEVESEGGGGASEETDLPLAEDAPPSGAAIRFYSGGAWHDGLRFGRDSLRPGHTVAGPAIVIEPHQTVVVEPGWQLRVTTKNHLLLERDGQRPPLARIGTGRDPVALELFNNRFTAIARQMGEALRQTARSVNIKERLDFSCALFDATGDMIANAPHIPVHLGSMDCSVKSLIADNEGRFRPGESLMLNAPYKGGTHLPDITVVTPVFARDGERLLFFVASRGHHADIGGQTPGSMGPAARSIEEEGVYIDNFRLVEDGRFREAEVRALLESPPHPARNPGQNIADLKAQVAANETGAQELLALVDQYGEAVVAAYMEYVKQNAEDSVRRAIDRLRDGSFTARMDGGLRVCVAITIDRDTRSARIDFAGTSPQHDGNFNAPEPITRAAVLYVFRTLIDADIPLNSGCLRPLEIVIPAGSLLSPRYPAAVAAGNVETSQVVTNCLFAALKALGSAQGTMNNLSFGDAEYQYYETICSSAPAGPGFNGADAVHTHMTNSRMTDPEILEQRFPVVVEQFQIQADSGGKGQWHAGNGVLRKLRFLRPMHCAIISGYREIAPFGLEGGSEGKVGENWVRRKDGKLERLMGCDETDLAADEAIIVKTPTGGGFGKA
jgi:5-oxoprolinase (ATP-hydrolysing)